MFSAIFVPMWTISPPHKGTGATVTGTRWCDDELNLPLSIPTMTSITNWHDDTGAYAFPYPSSVGGTAYIFPESCDLGCISTIDTVWQYNANKQHLYRLATSGHRTVQASVFFFNIYVWIPPTEET